MPFFKRKRKIKILKDKKYSEYYRVNDTELSALKRGAQLMEIARDFFKFGAGNQSYPYYGSDGESYIRWRKTRALSNITKNDDINDFISYFEELIVTHSNTENPDYCAENIIIAYYAACFTRGGNCRETSDLMAFLIIMFRGLPEDYRRIKLVYMGGDIAHYILIIESRTNNRAIVLDPWVPATQACLLEDSQWGGLDDDEYDEIWTINLDSECRFRGRYLQRLKQYGEADCRELVENNQAIQTLLEKGDSTNVFWECTYKKCLAEWTNQAIIEENGENYCPKCWNKNLEKKVQRIKNAPERRYYKIPIKNDNMEAELNLRMELYENLGIIDDSLTNEDKKHVIIPYTNKNKPDNEDIEFWKRHHLIMRTYNGWGNLNRVLT
jgi:hypothetical protein